MAEVEFAGVKFKGGKMVAIVMALSTLVGGLYGAFEVYKDYTNMKKKILSYSAPDLSGFDKKLAVMSKTMDTVTKEMASVRNRVLEVQGIVRDTRQDMRGRTPGLMRPLLKTPSLRLTSALGLWMRRPVRRCVRLKRPCAALPQARMSGLMLRLTGLLPLRGSLRRISATSRSRRPVGSTLKSTVSTPSLPFSKSDRTRSCVTPSIIRCLGNRSCHEY